MWWVQLVGMLMFAVMLGVSFGVWRKTSPRQGGASAVALFVCGALLLMVGVGLLIISA